MKVKYIEKQKGDVKDTLADTSKAKELLNWSPKVNIYEKLLSYLSSPKIPDSVWKIRGRGFSFMVPLL